MKNRYILIFLLLTGLPGISKVFSQAKKTTTAVRINEPIRIDGILDEPAWSMVSSTSGFVDLKPIPGNIPQQQTRVKVLFDDTGIYIGAEMDEDQMDQLGTELFERDDSDDSKKIDWFAVVLDCYQDGLNGFGFVVSASGVQTDIKFSGDNEDGEWDAVWDSDVHHDDNRWTCEIKIPYSAIRFPQKELQHWGIQFGRRSHQRQQESFWNPIDPEKNGFINQSGILEGIRDIQPPLRLSATPFLAVYAENYFDKNSNQRSSWGTSYNGGMDVKYGISDAYTLDMTLIPDFGQVQSDNEVLNLSPFEVQFNENRQFFTEGTELFDRADLFYSRRVGGTPFHYRQIYDQLGEHERVSAIREDSRLINATKISGRGKSGTGLGFFNAISPRNHALITNEETGEKREILLQPWTNYNVMAVDQSFKNNSYFSLINTNVTREGSAANANVTGIDFDFRDKENVYGIAAQAAYSQPGVNRENGFKYSVEIARHSGNLIWELGHDVFSDTYDPNDLGFINNNNINNWRGFAEYNVYKPFGPFLNASVGTFSRYGSLYRFPGNPGEQVRPNLLTSIGTEVWANGLLKNYYQINFWIYAQYADGYDYFEPRVPGRFFEYPAFKNFNFNVQTDYRKKLVLEGRVRYNKFHEKDKYQFEFEIESRFRINNHFSVRYEFEREFYTLDRGYITEIGNDIVFGARDYRDITQFFIVNYVFNPRMTFSLRLRHNWARVEYTQFYTLQLDGTLEDRDYQENEDINFNAWTIDANFRWRFSPGSDLFVVWKNSIFGEDDQSRISYSKNLRQLFENPQSNSLSVKAIYYIDFQRWK